jgi:hypothetical protein
MKETLDLNNTATFVHITLKQKDMNGSLLFWVYLANTVVLLVHEIDSAYWQEWKLIFPDEKNGINGFLLLHIPMIIVILLGLVYVYEDKFAGMIISLILSASGLFAFFFHFYHLRKGRPEFNTLVSKGIILSTLIISIIQIILTIKQLM